MADGSGGKFDLLLDSNFQKLASCKTDPEEFTSLLRVHVYGYTQKKHSVDALKDLLKRVDEAELKQSYAKNLGKKKGLEEAEQALVHSYSSHNLKDKVQILNAQIQGMIDEGLITQEEKPAVLENLKTRLAAAKTANKDKLQEKLEGMINSVSRAGPHVLQVGNLKEIGLLRRRLDEIHSLEKRPVKSLTQSEKEAIGKKVEVQDELRSLEERSTMWFESEFAFKPRLHRALEALAIEEADQRRREEEEAFEKKRKEEAEALEQKRLDTVAKEEEKHKHMLAKLEARRMEDQMKPQKPVVQQAKPKEKKKAKRLDPNSLFVHHRSTLADADADTQEEAEEWQDPNDEEGTGETPEPAAPQPAGAAPAAPADAAEVVPPAAGYPTQTLAQEKTVEPPQAPVASKAIAPARKKIEKLVLENKWGTDDHPASAAGQTDGEQLLDSQLPSLTDAKASAAAPVKKTPPPQPKKKEKKKFTKLGAAELGFDANNPNYGK